MDIWGEAAPGGGDFTPQLSIGLCKVNIGDLDSNNDPISPYANLDSYMGIWAEATPGGGRPTPQMPIAIGEASKGDLDGKSNTISLYTDLDL